MAAKAMLAMDRGLLKAGERVCVAVSGGADSVALLLAMVEANTESAQNKMPLGVVLRAAHVHHGLRGAEADGDEEFVLALCERLGVPVTVWRGVHIKISLGEGLLASRLDAARAV